MWDAFDAGTVPTELSSSSIVATVIASPQEAHEALPPGPPASSPALPQFPHCRLSNQGRRSPSMEKTCLSLMTKNGDHFFVHFLPAIWISFVKCLSSSFVRLLIRGFALSVLNFMILHISYVLTPCQEYSWSISFSILYAVPSLSCFLCLTEAS